MGERTEMKRRKAMIRTAAALLPSMLLSGCGLLPAEDTGGRVVLVQATDEVSYELAQAAIGDVELTKTIYCTYSQLKEENLSFGVRGPVQYVYVKTGDTVKEGDLLAKLYTDDLDNEIENLEYTVEKNEILLAQAQELKEFDLTALERSYSAGQMTNQQYQARVAEREESYKKSLQEYQDELYIAGLRLARCREQKAGSEIYAGMDGTVSYVRTNLQGSYIMEGNNAITVIDSTKCAFRSENMEYAEYYIPGEEVILSGGSGVEYVTTVMAPEDAPDNEHVYFALKELDFQLSVGTRATQKLVLDSRQNVLTIPISVMHLSAGQPYVYCEDEGGLKEMRYITTGLVGTKYVEVLDGLSEGDILIRK